MAQSTATKWMLKGTVLIACNCDYGCPCNFNALPTHGHCEGGWAWHVQDGRYGSTDLGGLTFSIAADWPQAIHEGNGEAAVLIDERANNAQREALNTLVSGSAGGPWGILKNTWTKVYEARYVTFEINLAEQRSRVKAGDILELEMEPIKNPVTAAEVTPGAVLPEGFITKDPKFAASRVFRVQNGVHYDHSGNYAAVGSFEYTGP
ncbi:MAG TPA: DUF1326 domain-containing protein [Candidatus Dormibacteraeota bacterium]|nr:DUF1326 domain-containing protein [Candidatus Dormibacteraeota bacterium]